MMAKNSTVIETMLLATVHGPNSISPRPTFASLNALEPCISKLCFTGISAVLKPSTIASAAAMYARLLDSSALGTCSNDRR